MSVSFRHLGYWAIGWEDWLHYYIEHFNIFITFVYKYFIEAQDDINYWYVMS